MFKKEVGAWGEGGLRWKTIKELFAELFAS